MMLLSMASDHPEDKCIERHIERVSVCLCVINIGPKYANIVPEEILLNGLVSKQKATRGRGLCCFFQWLKGSCYDVYRGMLLNPPKQL